MLMTKREIKRGQRCRVRTEGRPHSAAYFARRYGTERPLIRIEARDVDYFGRPWQHLVGEQAALYFEVRTAGCFPVEGSHYVGRMSDGSLEIVHEDELEEVDHG